MKIFLNESGVISSECRFWPMELALDFAYSFVYYSRKETKMKELIPEELIERKIFLLRGQKVMLSIHLAGLYGVGTKVLIQSVKRNAVRFPEDFMFQLTPEEAQSLRSQFVTLKNRGSKRGKHPKYLPYAFTEQGVAMLSSVLRSKKAVLVNIAIMRAFVKLRQILSAHKELAHKLEELERKIAKHDAEIQGIFEAIRQLMVPPEKPKRRIGFQTE
jgi:phage regulator Rha-like protein